MAKKSAATGNGASAPAVPPRQLVFQDGSANKFWNIELSGNAHTVTFGRVGTQGQQQTKEFASEEEARKSHDKLVAEKLKKGYIEAAGNAATAPPTGTAAKPAAKPKAAKAAAEGRGLTAAPAGQAPAAVAVDLDCTRRLDLEPADWYRATLRPRKPLVRGEARPFDREACLERLAKLRTETYGWDIRWRDLHLPPGLSREEAHFWLEAMTLTRDRKTTPKQFAAKLAKQEFKGDLDRGAIVACLKRQDRGLPDEILLLLPNLLPIEEILSVFLQKPSKKKNAWQYDNSGAEMVKAFGQYILPYLNDTEVGTVRRTIRKDWDPTQSANDYYEAMPVAYYLAAALGMHGEVYAVTSSWPDDRYTKDQWHDHYHRPQDLVLGLGSPELVAAEWRRLKLRMRDSAHVRAFLACTECAALDCVRDSILAETKKERAEELLKAFARVHAPEAAEPMLECKLESKMPAVARDWLDEHIGCAVAGLIGTVGRRGKLADAALEYLRDVRRRGHGEVISSSLRSVTDADLTARIQQDVIDYREKVYTPLDDGSTPDWLSGALAEAATLKAPRAPAWCAATLLPPLTLGNSRLNDEQVAAVIRALMATPVGNAHPLLTAVREHVPPHIRDEFAWKLFTEWLAGGAPSKEKWAMGAIGHLGADACVLRLTPLVRAWPGESQHARAVFGLECLRAIGSDVALMQLSGVAQKLKFKGLKATAEKFVNEIAQERGMTRAELEDRVVPDCSLDEQGRREFSFGTRTFSFVLGSDLKAMVCDTDGKLRGDLPKPSGKDDAAVAAQSLAEWKLMKKQIKEVATIQAGRLEQAMVTGRRWRVADFETLIVRHPLMTHLARQLLWGAFDAKGRRGGVFRVTEERDYADAKDEAVSLASAESVGVLHPLDLSEAERSAWGQVLGDYEIIAPFPQLGRAVFALEAGEAERDDLARLPRPETRRAYARLHPRETRLGPRPGDGRRLLRRALQTVSRRGRNSDRHLRGYGGHGLHRPERDAHHYALPIRQGDAGTVGLRLGQG